MNVKIGVKEAGCESVDCINFVQNMVQWWTFVNTRMNLRLHKRWAIS
jgi:hypothetical protein